MTTKKIKTVRRPFALSPELWEKVDAKTTKTKPWQDVIAECVEKALKPSRSRSKASTRKS